MFHCPICDAILTDDDMQSARCPHCASLVLWNDDASDSGPARRAAEPTYVPPPPPPDEGPPRLVDSNPSLGQVMATIVSRAAYEAQHPVLPGDGDNAATPPAPPAAETPPPEPEPKPRTHGPGDATIDIGTGSANRLPAADLSAHVERIWRNTIAPSTTPRMTLKSDVAVPDAQAGLVIRARQLRQAGEYGVAEADYELLERIGEGGVGIVYAARQASIDRTVAIKMLKPESKLDADSRQKFLSEAVVTGDLDHPNIVPVYDLGADERGALFYSMKRVRGTPWLDVMASKSLPENLEILMKVADAIAFAHSRDVVHRDIKPENIMLGDFGEVLVMDWGIALSTSLTVHSGSIGQSTSMGGTPAYMAPEMATGPVEKIGPHSDVYLLGATLYEIITGHPPHTGKDVIRCLHAAARNEIRPTDKSGELLELAYKAMATDPAQRFASVREFQDAIRAYQSHSESIALATRAAEDLRKAEETRIYQDYARAVFACQEALALWPQNTSAAEVLETAELAYAQAAYEKEDFDLGLSLLDPFNTRHQPLLHKLALAQKERAARLQRLATLRRTALGLALAIFLVVSGGLVYIREQYEIQKDTSAQLSREKDKLEDRERDLKKEQANLARTASALEVQRGVAEENAKEARRSERATERTSYLSEIGLAAAQSRENAFLNIRASLDKYTGGKLAYLRHWEWGRLRHISQLAERDLPAAGRVEALAVDHDQKLVVSGSAAGKLQFWNTETWDVVTRDLGRAIVALAIDEAHGRLAVSLAGDGGRFHVQPLDAWREGAIDELLRSPFEAHRDDVVSLAFSSDGERIVATSLDQTASVWSLATRTPITLTGHTGPVWCAVFAPADDEVITAGDDRTVCIWNATTGGQKQRFRGHTGPVLAVACAAIEENSYQVVSAGQDRRVLLWDPAKVRGVDYQRVKQQILERPTAPGATSAASEPDYRVLGTHDGDIDDVAFASGGKQVISCGHDNTVRVWDVTADQARSPARRILRGHGGWVQACAMLDADRVVSAGYDQTLKVWNLQTYEEFRELQGHDDAVTFATFSRDGTHVVTAGRDRKAIVWEVATGKQVAVLDEGHQFLTSTVIFFGPGDDRLLTSAGDGSAIIWSLASGGEQLRLHGTGSNAAAAVAPGGEWVATGSSTNDVCVWRLTETGAEPHYLQGHNASVTCVAFAPTAQGTLRLFTGDSSGAGLLWTWDADSDAWKLAGKIRGHYWNYAITAARFTPDGKRLLTAGADRMVKQWRAIDGAEIPESNLIHAEPVRLLEVIPGTTLAATVSVVDKHDVVQLWDYETGRLVQVRPMADKVQSIAADPTGESLAIGTSGDNALWRMDVDRDTIRPFWPAGRLRSSVWGIAFSPDGENIVTAGGNRARMWSIARAERVRSFSPHGPLVAADFSPDGTHVVTAGQDGTAKIWNIAEGTVVAQLEGGHLDELGRPQPLTGVVFLPRADEEDRLLTTAGDGKAVLWKFAGGKVEIAATLENADGPILRAAASRDGRRLVVGGQRGMVKILASDGTVLHNLTDEAGHTLDVRAVAFSSDGRLVISGGDDNLAIVWNAHTGERLRRLAGHTAGVTAVAFSPDGRRALTSSNDGTAKLWDVQQGNEILTLDAHRAEVSTCSFSADGRLVLTAGHDRRALIWPSESIPPALALDEPQLVYREKQTWVAIDGAPQFTDADVATFAGARLSATLSGETAEGFTEELRLATDPRLSIADGVLHWDDGTQPSPLPVARLGSDSSRAQIELELLEGANHYIVESLLAAIEYRATWEEKPPAGDRKFVLHFTDAEGATASAEKTIQFDTTGDTLDSDLTDRALAAE